MVLDLCIRAPAERNVAFEAITDSKTKCYSQSEPYNELCHSQSRSL